MSVNPNLSCPYCASHELRLLGKLPDSHWFAGKPLPESLSGGALYRCHDCLLKFRYPAYDTSIYQALYDNAGISTWPVNTTRSDWDLIVSHIHKRLPQGGRVLDFGCYTGGLLARLGSAYERHGVEINRAAATAAADNEHVHIWPSIDDIPEKLRFDIVVASDVIEHMPNPGYLIDILFTMLADGGILIITTGDANNYLWERFGANWWYCFYPEHIAFISESWICNFCQARNFLIERCERFHYCKLSTRRYILEAASTCFYGLLPSIYIRLGDTLRNILNRPRLTSAPGNGVSADHLFIVLSRKEIIQ